METLGRKKLVPREDVKLMKQTKKENRQNFFSLSRQNHDKSLDRKTQRYPLKKPINY
jgi:hypothetical protein